MRTKITKFPREFEEGTGVGKVEKRSGRTFILIGRRNTKRTCAVFAPVFICRNSPRNRSKKLSKQRPEQKAQENKNSVIRKRFWTDSGCSDAPVGSPGHPFRSPGVPLGGPWPLPGGPGGAPGAPWASPGVVFGALGGRLGVPRVPGRSGGLPGWSGTQIFVISMKKHCKSRYIFKVGREKHR